MTSTSARRWVAAVALAAALPSGFGSARADDGILTDRPDFTETSFVVAPRQMQLESGFTLSRESGSQAPGDPAAVVTWAVPEALLRIGLVPRLELRLGYDDAWIESSGARQSEPAAVSAGAKLQLRPDGSTFGMALIPALAFPDPGESAEVDPEIALAWAYDPGRRWSLGGILAYASEASMDHGTATVSLGRELGERWGSFVEWVFESVQGETANQVHHGHTLSLGPNAQLDVHLGLGIDDRAPDFFIGAGFALRR